MNFIGLCAAIILWRMASASLLFVIGSRMSITAMASGVAIPPAFFGSLNDLIACELEYETSTDYLDDQAYWTKNLPPEGEPRYRLAPAVDGRDPYESLCTG